MTDLEGRVALVTGCGSETGIGFACARLLKAAGAKVAITSTTERILDRRSELGNEGSFARAADLTEPGAVERLVDAAETALGPIDILVNNAGMVQIGRDQPSRPVHEVTDQAWRYGMDINLTSTFNMIRAVLPGMRERRYGRIVNISSVTGPVVAISGSGVYGAAKAGMLGLTRAIVLESASHGVTANCIGPGWIETGSSSESEVTAGGFTPTGRPGTPEEIGHVAVFLASEGASYLNGQMIVVDGGNTIQEYKVALP